jgi:hypothetical protein
MMEKKLKTFADLAELDRKLADASTLGNAIKLVDASKVASQQLADASTPASMLAKASTKQQLNVRIDPFLAHRLSLFCAKTRLKLQDIVALALENFLDQHEELLPKLLAKQLAPASMLADNVNVNVSKEIKNNVNVTPLVQDILAVVGDEHSRAFYIKIARGLDPDLIYRALSEVKEEERLGMIRTTKGAVFTDKIKRWAAERGMQL